MSNLEYKIFTETNSVKKYFVEKLRINYYQQIYKDGLPIGSPGLLKSDYFEEANVQNINKILDDFAKPLIESGSKVAIEYFITKKLRG